MEESFQKVPFIESTNVQKGPDCDIGKEDASSLFNRELDISQGSSHLVLM